MATQTYDWIVRAQAVGWDKAAQEVLRGTSEINRALSNVESRSVNLRPSAFANVPEKSRPGTVDQSVLRAEARAYDEVARAAVRLRDAELARVEAVRRTRGVFAKDYIKDPVARERLDSRTLAALDVASQRHQEATAAADRAKAEADSRRAMFGPTVAQSMFNDRGGIAYPGKGDLFNNQIQAAIGRAQQETLAAAREEASLRKQRNVSIRRDLTEGIKEAGERRRQAAADAEGARQMALYNAQKAVPFANPDLSTRVGVAQDAVNRASRALAAAEQARTDLINKGNPTAQQLIASDRVLEAANSNLTRARLAEARAAAHVSHSTTRLGQTRDQFMSGFRGQSDMPYAQQIGQAFKFSLFYGTAYKLLFALTTTLTATLQEGIQFQQAMTELKIASGQSADAANEMAAVLGDEATAAGLAPSQGVLLGARSLGLFGGTQAAGATEAEQERIATISAHVVSRMALGSKTTPEELQTQVAAVANAFGGGAAGQIRAYDLDAYLARQFGIGQGMTVQAVAESGTVGQAAGFDQEQVSAIAAYLQSRTGQTPSAVAGWMAQIFSRGGEGSLTALTGKYGIDQSADLATQIQELAQVYKRASDTERAELAAGFGRGKVQNAAVVLLEGLDTVMRTADAARTESVGEGDRVFDLRIGDIGGQIKQTVAVMQAFASEMGRTGILEILGAGVVVFREVVEAATQLLRAWNELDGAVRAVVGSLLILAAAQRNAAVTSALAPLAARGGMVGTPAAMGMGVYGPPTQAAASAGALRSVGAMGAAALRFIGPVGLAITGLMGVASLYSSSKELQAAQEATAQALHGDSGLSFESSSSDVEARISELKLQATQEREATGRFHNWITLGTANDASEARATTIDDEVDRLQSLADALRDREESRAGVPTSAVAGFDAESLTRSMDLITASGGTANEQLDALTAALFGTADAAAAAQEAFDSDLFSNQLSETVTNNVANWVPQINLGKGRFEDMSMRDPEARWTVPMEEYTTGFGGMVGHYETKQVNVADLLPDDYRTKLAERMRAALDARGIDSFGDINKEVAAEIANEVAAETDAGKVGDSSDPDALANFRARIAREVQATLMGQTKEWRQLLKGNVQLTSEEVVSLINGINTTFDAVAADLPETDLKGRVANDRNRLRHLLKGRDQTPDEDMPALVREIGIARSRIAKGEIERIEAVRRAAQQNARSAAEVRAAGRAAMRGRIRAAIEGGNPDDLAAAISASGKGAIALARNIISEAIAAVKAALGIRAQIYEVQVAAEGVLDGMATFIGPTDPSILKRALRKGERLAELQDFLDGLDTALAGDGLNDSQGADVPGAEKWFEKDKAGKTKEQREAEREQARQEMLDLQSNLYLLSIDMRDPLAMAVAAVKDARRRLQSDIASGQDAGTIAASRVALRQAQIEQQETARQEMLELRNNLYLLSIDLTDPLAQATAGVKDARRRLQSDIAAGATPSVIAGDKVAIKQAEAEREATAFQQRLDAVTTAEELGRISHRKYLSYLENERRRLDGIKNRTFQQQEQLDQIDRLMKSAADSMQGMWNFGDIKLPTPYQVRRQVEQMRLDRSTQLDATSRQVASQSTIYIDGADTGKVRQIINETLSKSNATVTNRPRRR